MRKHYKDSSQRHYGRRQIYGQNGKKHNMNSIANSRASMV